MSSSIAGTYNTLAGKIDREYHEPRGAVLKARATYDAAYADLTAAFSQELAAEYAPHVTPRQKDALYAEAVSRAGDDQFAFYGIESNYQHLATTFFPQG